MNVCMHGSIRMNECICAKVIEARCWHFSWKLLETPGGMLAILALSPEAHAVDKVNTLCL